MRAHIVRALGALVFVALVVIPSVAHADTAAWNGYRALGVADAQLGPLNFVTSEALDDGGLVDDVIQDVAVVQRCGTSIACHCTALRGHGVRFGVFGSMGRLGDLWTIELTLVDAHSCTVAATQYLEESLAAADVAPRLSALARQITTPAEQIAETATGGGALRPIDATPSIVTTFTRSQLTALNIRTLEDLFPLVPGFDVVNASWGGVIVNQGLPATLLFLADGVPLVNGLNNFRALGRDFRSSFAHVDRIEIVRGPGAVLWGQNAFLGVVNMITDTPTRREAAVAAGLTVGTLDTQEAWVRGAQNRGVYSVAISVDAGRRVGPQIAVPDSPYAVLLTPAPLTFGNGGTTRPGADVWLDAHVRLALGDRLELSVQNLTSDVEFEISPRGPLLDPGHGGYWRKTHRLYALRGSQPVYDEEGAKVTLRATASRYELYSWESFAIQPRWPGELEQPMGATRDLSPGLTSIQGNDRPRVAHQLDFRMVHDYAQALDNQLTVGIGVLHQQTPTSLATLTGIDDDPATHTESFEGKHFLTLSSFVFDELSPTPWLALNAGARVQVDKPNQPEVPLPEPATWRVGARFQGGAAVRSGAFGGKLLYAEGFRPAEAVQLFSKVGTEGNPLLVPEQSRELASLASVEIVDGLTLRAGGNLTRISKLILLDPMAVSDPKYAYKPVNRGTIDLASGFLEAQLSSRSLDGFASWHVTGLRESDPLGTGIPLARHTAAVAVIWRPLEDLSFFARGSVASSRRLRVVTATNPSAPASTDATLRSAIGMTVTDLMAGADLQITVDNPLLRDQDAPYQLDGTTAGLIERRTGTELFATLRYDQ